MIKQIKANTWSGIGIISKQINNKINNKANLPNNILI